MPNAMVITCKIVNKQSGPWIEMRQSNLITPLSGQHNGRRVTPLEHAVREITGGWFVASCDLTYLPTDQVVMRKLGLR